MVRTMYGKLFLAAAALIAGIGLLWLWKVYGASETTLYASVIAIVVALFWGLQYAILTGRLIVTKSGRINIGWHGAPGRGASTESSAQDETADSAVGEPSLATLLSASDDDIRSDRMS
jgi:hypothetical protein